MLIARPLGGFFLSNYHQFLRVLTLYKHDVGDVYVHMDGCGLTSFWWLVLVFLHANN